MPETYGAQQRVPTRATAMKHSFFLARSQIAPARILRFTQRLNTLMARLDLSFRASPSQRSSLNHTGCVVKQYALSLKQPWAALLVAGVNIEVRKWPTARRGHVLLHAALVPDPRPEVWQRVPAQLLDSAHLLGGIIGAGDLMNCVAYNSTEEFALDRELHWNDPTWFEPPLLYGFVFANLTALPFRAYPGWMRFFEVGDADQRRK